MSTKVTKVSEVQTFLTHREGTPDVVIAALVAVGWEVAEEREDATVLVHELIPGSQRIVHLP